MRTETFKQLSNVMSFYINAIELLDKNKTYEVNLIKSVESFFGRTSLRMTIVIPELSMLLFTAKSSELNSLIHKHRIECVDNIFISFELMNSKKYEFEISQYKQGYADCGAELIHDAIANIVRGYKNLVLQYEDITKNNFVI